MSFFVTMICGRRVAWLAGPFATHEEALSLVPACRREAEKIDGYTHFNWFGTARSERTRAGVLNDRLAFEPQPHPSASGARQEGV